jgi:hypothetical protein
MGHRLAHREESLMQIERPPEQHPEQLACAAGFSPQRFAEFLEPVFMMRFGVSVSDERGAANSPPIQSEGRLSPTRRP